MEGHLGAVWFSKFYFKVAGSYGEECRGVGGRSYVGEEWRGVGGGSYGGSAEVWAVGHYSSSCLLLVGLNSWNPVLHY